MVIFVDMDDVIADTYGKHIEMYNEEYKQCLSLAHFESGEVWQNVPEMHQDSIRRHARTDGFFRNLEPIKNSIAIMKELCEKHEVYIASAATQFPNSLREKSDWLDQYFPFITWEYRRNWKLAVVNFSTSLTVILFCLILHIMSMKMGIIASVVGLK